MIYGIVYLYEYTLTVYTDGEKLMLTDREIEYGFDYYFKDDPTLDCLTEVSEYKGQKEIVLSCTQLDETYSAKEKKRITTEWCSFLREHPSQFTKIHCATRLNQELFDALCAQENLVDLSIKWAVLKNIEAISNCTKLERLHFGSTAGVVDITPLCTLTELKALTLENFKKVTDYSPLSALTTLESLTIEGDGLGPQYIKIESLEFLREMPQLRFLRILTARLQDTVYDPVLSLTELEHLTLPSNKGVQQAYTTLISLPKLKYGLLKMKPELYCKN